MNTYSDIDLSTAFAVGPEIEEQPFEGDTQSAIIRQRFWQRGADFARSALDTPHPERPQFYLVRETDPRPVQNGVIEFERVHAAIPAPRVEPEFYGFTVPGIETLGIFAVVGVTSAASAGNQTTITTAAAHGFEPGDAVQVEYFVVFANGSQVLRRVFRIAQAGTAASSLVVPQIADSGEIYWPGASVFPPAGRGPFSVVVPSEVHFDYFLPGISAGVNQPEDIPVLQAWQIIGTDGNVTQTLSDLTTPSAADYRAMIATGQRLVAEPSMARRWMGNIFERVTRYVSAT